MARALSRAATPVAYGNPASIGSYEVVRKLATGGMGEVYLAKQRGPVAFSRDVVLKKLHPGYTSNSEFVTMFLNEAQIAASLAHPNIIHIYELFEDDGYVIAMEYVRGGTALSLLRAHARQGRAVPFGPSLRIAISVCEALHYAYNSVGDHGQPRHVIHRDISPSNVLIDYDGHVKLADFGVAKALDVNLTRGASIKGKFGYLSPEQIRCQPLDQRSDLFSLAIVLWELTVGAPLFKRENDVAMMYAVMEEDIPRPSSRHADYPVELDAAIMKALERDRDDRYATPLELASELRRIAREYGWDLEAQALAELVRYELPEDQVAFGRIGSEEFSGGGPLARSRTTFGAADDLRSYPSLEVVATESGNRRAMLATTLVMAVLSAIFWLWIVPVIP